ncbi:MAG: hypothetical protein HYX67_10750, partial [Candidatus Melainabacteria bacterium]|nr:hypothetical protein [Candidatus Melainabacteria bacterium]
MSDFREKEEQPELVVPSAVNLNAEEEADELASLVQQGSQELDPKDPSDPSDPKDPSAPSNSADPQAPSDPLDPPKPPNPSDASDTSNSMPPPPNSGAKKASLGKSFSLVAILTVVS